MTRLALIGILVAVACAPSAAPSRPASPEAPVQPTSSAGRFAAACGVARETVQAISEEMLPMVDAIARSDLKSAFRHRDKAHDLAAAAIRALPEGYRDEPALADFSDRVHDVMSATDGLPEATEASNAAIELMGTGPELATCSGAAP